eukprot:1159828-Pelagomonas_calceolata.AAC.14
MSRHQQRFMQLNVKASAKAPAAERQGSQNRQKQQVEATSTRSFNSFFWYPDAGNRGVLVGHTHKCSIIPQQIVWSHGSLLLL